MSPALYDQLMQIINGENLIALKDGNCIAADYYDLFGDECKQAKIKVDFDAKTTAAGTKLSKITATIRGARYFYKGTFTAKP